MRFPSPLKDIFRRQLSEGLLAATSRGVMSNVLSYHKFGKNPAVGTTDETVWDAGGLYPWQASAMAVTLVSTDVDDTFGGSGCQLVKIQGLDENWDLYEEVVQMDGQSPVAVGVDMIRIFRLSTPALTDGSGKPIAGAGDCQGTITAVQGGIVRAQIDNGNNQTLMAIFSVPRNFTGLLYHGSASIGKGQDAILKFMARTEHSPFSVVHIVDLYQDIYNRPFTVPHPLAEKADLEIRAASSAGENAISANFDMILIKNTGVEI